MYRKKTTIIIVMCVAILFMATGYALLSTKLNINGSTAVISNWRVEFSNIRTIEARGGATNVTTPSYTATTATFNVDLVMPGDEITYEIDITNYGETKAEVKSANYISTDSDIIYVYIEKIRKGTVIDACTDQSACPTISMKVIVGYSENSDSVLVDETKTIDLSLEIGQYVEGSPIEDGVLLPELSSLLVTQIKRQNKENIVTSGDGLYVSTATNDGSPTYYYKGNVTNNYVDFAGQTWRVVRINEDGTIKLILDDRINDTTYPFNSSYHKYEYMYYSESNVTNGIKNTVDTWYENTLKANYDSYISTTSFCEAAKVKGDDSYTSGNATMELESNYTPNYKCELDGNNKQYVTEKVGLITVDEAAMAGIPLYTGSQTNNTNTYLQKSYYWWTMSPAGFSNNNYNYNYANAWYVNNSVYVNYYNVLHDIGVRPVISLNADTLVTGSGASDDMWVVQMK